MKILGVLQNQWFRDPERVRQMIARTPEIRRRLIAYSLFAGCKTGRVLQQVFGDLCDTIIWEEASREIAGNASAVFPADLDHLRAVLKEHDPDCVIAFGKVASDALRQLVDAPRLLIAPHPAARQPDTLLRLRNIRAALP